MAITNGYCDLSDVKPHLNLNDSDDDTAISLAIEASSRLIDSECGRRFYLDTTATARVFTASSCDLVEVNDISATTDLVVKTDEDGDGVYETTWTSSMYQLEPLNQRSESGELWPYTTIRARHGYRFPVCGDDALVQVTARWGWPVSHPVAVKLACIAQTVTGWKAPTQPFGVAGSNEFGVLRISTKLHPTAASYLGGYVRTVVGV